MTRWLFQALIVGAALGTAMPVPAAMCYEIIDRNGVVIFRDTSSPVDLSAAGAPAREAMRDRGELLVIFDVDACVVIGRTSQTGGRTLTTDEIVAGWQSFGKSGFGGTYGARVVTDSGGGISAPMPSGDRPINIELR
jgi:hypothetical protein